MVAVVGDEHDHRAVGDAGTVERVEQLADLGVEVGDVGEITVPHLGRLRRGRRPAFAQDLRTFVERLRGRAGRPTAVVVRELFASVERPVFRRGVEGRVRFPEADREEERPVLDLGQRAYGLRGDASVVVGLVRHVAAFRHRHLAVFPQAGDAGHLVRRQRTRDHGRVIAMVGVMQELRRAPGARIAFLRRVPVVEDLAHAARLVARELEPLGQGDHVGPQLAEVDRVIPEPDGIRPQACQERGARGVADRLLAIGRVEASRARIEPDQVGRVGPQPAHAGFDPEVVGHDEQHVRGARRAVVRRAGDEQDDGDQDG